MTVTLVYDDILSRVRVSVTGLPVEDPATVSVERSTDQVRWTTVRGGASLTPTGGAVSVDDYEFAPDVPNYYRVRGPMLYDAFARTTVSGWGSLDYGGQAWATTGGSPSDYSTDGTAGIASCGSVNVSRFTQLPGVSLTDGRVAVTVAVPVTAAGDDIVTGPRLRDASGSYYWAKTKFTPLGTVTLELEQREPGATTLAGPVTVGSYTAGQAWRVELDVSGSTVRGRAWPASNSAPTGWNLEGVGTLTAPGAPGTRTILEPSNTNVLPVQVRYSDWVMSSPTAVIDASGYSDPNTATPTIADTFSRTVADAWGTADSGGTWTNDGGTAADYDVAPGSATHSLATVNASRRSTLGSVIDSDITTSVTIPVIAVGDSIDVGPVSRYAGGSYYHGVLHCHSDGTLDLRIRKLVDSLWTTLAVSGLIPGGYTASSTWRIRFRTAGSSLLAKAWRDGETEPAAWTIGTADSDLTAAGAVGVRSNLQLNYSGTLPVTVAYHSFEVRTPGAVTAYQSIAPDLGGVVWLKSVAHPFLNRAIVVQDYSDVEAPSRAGVFDVVGRSRPVAVTDDRGSDRWTLSVYTATRDEASDLRLLLASGDILLVQVPAGVDMPDGYVTVGDVVRRRVGRTSLRRVFDLPCIATDPPGSDVVGATATYAAIANAFATYADVAAAFATYADMGEYVADPSDVIV